MNESPLKFLHSESALVQLKLEYLRRLSTEELIESLKPDRESSLKTKPDGTIMDGHHRIKVLMERGVEVDKLPREIWKRVR